MSIDLYGIGNALVDSEYIVSEAILSQTGFAKGTMTLVDAEQRQHLIALLEDTSNITLSKRAGGGSAANTVVTTALLGGSTFYSCKVSNDETGDFFAQDLSDLSVATNLAEARPAGVTGECISMITPDGERTLVTHLGITETLSTAEVDETCWQAPSTFTSKATWSPHRPRSRRFLKPKPSPSSMASKSHLTLSDVGLVENFKTEFNTLFQNGVDLVFCNEDEAKLWTGYSDRDQAAQALIELCRKLCHDTERGWCNRFWQHRRARFCPSRQGPGPRYNWRWGYLCGGRPVWPRARRAPRRCHRARAPVSKACCQPVRCKTESPRSARDHRGLSKRFRVRYGRGRTESRGRAIAVVHFTDRNAVEL